MELSKWLEDMATLPVDMQSTLRLIASSLSKQKLSFSSRKTGTLFLLC